MRLLRMRRAGVRLVTAPRFEFGEIEADGTHIIVHVRVNVAGLFKRSMQVKLTEEGAARLIARTQAAVAKLGRMRLGAAEPTK